MKRLLLILCLLPGCGEISVGEILTQETQDKFAAYVLNEWGVTLERNPDGSLAWPDTPIPGSEPDPTVTDPATDPDPVPNDWTDVQINDMSLGNDYVAKGCVGDALDCLSGHRRVGSNEGRPYLRANWMITEGQDNTAHAESLMVELKDAETYVLAANGTWHRLHESKDFKGRHYHQDSDHFTRPLTSFGQNFALRSAKNAHGWWGGARLEVPGDAKAIVATIAARLVGDECSTAQYQIMVSADWFVYPYRSASEIPPAAGVSRFKWLGCDWAWVNMTTLTDVGIQPSVGIGITSDELRANRLFTN